MGILPVTQLHCVPCGLARGQCLDQTRKFKMGPNLFKNSKINYFPQKSPIYQLISNFKLVFLWEGTSHCPFVPGKIILSRCPFVPEQGQKQKSQEELLCLGTK